MRVQRPSSILARRSHAGCKSNRSENKTSMQLPGKTKSSTENMLFWSAELALSWATQRAPVAQSRTVAHGADKAWGIAVSLKQHCRIKRNALIPFCIAKSAAVSSAGDRNDRCRNFVSLLHQVGDVVLTCCCWVFGAGDRNDSCSDVVSLLHQAGDVVLACCCCHYGNGFMRSSLS